MKPTTHPRLDFRLKAFYFLNFEFLETIIGLILFGELHLDKLVVYIKQNHYRIIYTIFFLRPIYLFTLHTNKAKSSARQSSAK